MPGIEYALADEDQQQEGKHRQHEGKQEAQAGVNVLNALKACLGFLQPTLAFQVGNLFEREAIGVRVSGWRRLEADGAGDLPLVLGRLSPDDKRLSYCFVVVCIHHFIADHLR